MADTPDFDQIARPIVDGLYSPDDMADPAKEIPAAIAMVAEQLRLVWNARGAADIAKLEAVYSGPFTKLQDRQLLDRAIRSLDR